MGYVELWSVRTCRNANESYEYITTPRRERLDSRQTIVAETTARQNSIRGRCSFVLIARLYAGTVQHALYVAHQVLSIQSTLVATKTRNIVTLNRIISETTWVVENKRPDRQHTAQRQTIRLNIKSGSRHTESTEGTHCQRRELVESRCKASADKLIIDNSYTTVRSYKLEIKQRFTIALQ